jgi:hypothetical protein
MSTASENQVKRYLAYWFQLGKRVLLRNGEAILPHPIIRGDRYSEEFEQCWQQLLDHHSGDCYLEGTTQTIQELLSPRWEITSCSRCQMPVPMVDVGLQSGLCPCHDLSDWPNNELPKPREPINTKDRLKYLVHKLRKTEL